jgi:hypothetical protein
LGTISNRPRPQVMAYNKIGGHSGALVIRTLY